MFTFPNQNLAVRNLSSPALRCSLCDVPRECLENAVLSLVVLSGSLDQYSAQAVKEDVLSLLSATDQGGKPSTSITLDLSTVDHLDATGLQILLSLRKGVSNKAVSLKGASPELRNWIRLAGAEHLFEFVSTEI